jgi:flagellar M-ring protein FliF
MSERSTGIGRRGRVALLGAVAAAALAVAPGPAATASTGDVPGAERAAAVQSVLDRVLGPGDAVVTIADTVRTSTTATSTVRYSGGAAGSVATSAARVGGVVTSSASSTRNLVGGTSTVVVTPPGTLLRQDVSVAIDKAHLGGRSLPALRRLVATAAGVVPSRGDRVALVVTPFARAAAASAAAPPSVLALLLPSLVPLIWASGGLLALLVGVLMLRGRRPRGGLASS